MKISKWPFFVAKIWQTTSTDQQIRKGGSQKNTRKLRMQGGCYETKKDGKGTGIGLTVVKRMVEEHGGWIQVQSEEEKGTTFIMNFPRVDDFE